jgi:periplasmic copper chaperone A
MTAVPPRWRAPARTACSLFAALLGALLLTVLGSGIAAAHVTAQPGWATKGGYAMVALRVPSESDTAGTVKVEVTLPAEHPIAEVLTTPMTGWTERITRIPVNPPLRTDDGTVGQVAHTITWTAQPGKRLDPSQFADFDVSMGPLPEDADQLVLPVVQTYDDGTVVRWDQPRAAGGAEPEHPAPTLALRAAAGAGHGAETAATMAVGGSGGSTSDGDTTARWLGGAGLLLGVIALIVAAGVAGRTRRARQRPVNRHGRPPTPPEPRVSTSSGGRRST